MTTKADSRLALMAMERHHRRQRRGTAQEYAARSDVRRGLTYARLHRPMGGGSTSAPAVVPALPFTSSAHEHTEPAFTVTVTPGASTQQLNPIDIPAYGYIRSVFLEVVATGGAGGTLAADGPWNLFSSILLQDVNGGNTFGPMDGYSAYIANLCGGLAGNMNPANGPWFVGSAPNPAFFLRVPIEVDHEDGLGSLSNQNSAANYKLSLGINTAAALASVAFTTVPTFTIKGWLEAWTLPAPSDNRGRPQAQTPPLLGTGQYWSSTNRPVLTGAGGPYAITRVGNLIRTIPMIFRDGSGVRQDTVCPDPLQFNWDGMQIHNASQRYLIQYFFEKIVGAMTRPTGVFLLPFSHFGALAVLGEDAGGAGWLPTTQSSRIEIAGSSAVAGSVQFLVNEVAPIEVNQAQRYQDPSHTGSVSQGAPVAGRVN